MLKCSPLDAVKSIFSIPSSPPRMPRPYFLALNVGGLYRFSDNDDASTETDDNAMANAATYGGRAVCVTG